MLNWILVVGTATVWQGPGLDKCINAYIQLMPDQSLPRQQILNQQDLSVGNAYCWDKTKPEELKYWFVKDGKNAL